MLRQDSQFAIRGVKMYSKIGVDGNVSGIRNVVVHQCLSHSFAISKLIQVGQGKLTNTK